jgi:hypothetical protein
LTVVVTFGFALLVRPDAPAALPGYVALALLSCLFVTKDEPVHARLCGPGEQWLHALLFVLHPVVFLCYALLWRDGGYRWVMVAQLLLTAGFGVYQVVYWSEWWRSRRA